jgi:hypothetical protein
MLIFATEKSFFGEKDKTKGKFLNHYGKAMAAYKTAIDPVIKWEYARECLRYIEWAYDWGLIIHNDFNRRINELETENTQLKQIKAELEATITDLKQKLSDKDKLLQIVHINETSTYPPDEQDDE